LPALDQARAVARVTPDLNPKTLHHMSVYIAEFLGTMLLVLLGNGVVANVVLAKTKGHGGGWITIAWGWGMAVMVAVYAVGRISGAHINPAVTVSLASIGAFKWALVPGYIIAQMAGGIAGACLVYLAYLPHWRETADQASKLACYSTGPQVRQPIANFITELIGTFVLIFGVLAIGSAAKAATAAGLQQGLELAFSGWLAPLLVGLLVLSIGLSLGGPTGYAINPARDLGPRIAHALLPIHGKGPSDWGYAWIPVLAPLVGGICAARLFVALGY
jgi:glycerol uptake facilitator protein